MQLRPLAHRKTDNPSLFNTSANRTVSSPTQASRLQQQTMQNPDNTEVTTSELLDLVRDLQREMSTL